MLVDGLYKAPCGCYWPAGTTRYCAEHGCWSRPPTFEDWWRETYEGRLGSSPMIEKAFKEVAHKAWHAAFDSERDMQEEIRNLRRQPDRKE